MYGRIRQATMGDALEVAAIIDIAGHGIDLECWLKGRDEDHSVLAAARRVVLEDHTRVYHFSRAHVIECDGRIAGGLIGGLVDEKAEAEVGLPPHLEPLVALEHRVPGYWSLVALAVYPEFRGNGLASRLLDHAAHLASQSGARGLSIVVEDTNTTAIALYRRKGFELLEQLPWIGYGDRTGPSHWLMLAKAV